VLLRQQLPTTREVEAHLTAIVFFELQKAARAGSALTEMAAAFIVEVCSLATAHHEEAGGTLDAQRSYWMTCMLLQ
jgi:hypothetical protein